MRIILATHNSHKLIEVQAMLASTQWEVVGLDQYPELGEIPEDHDTMEANAIQKADTVFRYTGLPTVADDSGIEIRALNWAPGVYSKRWTPEETDEANNAKLLRKLDGHSDRMAQYRCAIAFVTEQGTSTAEGICTGTIGHTLTGSGGFGYDPLFWPTDFPGRTMAQITLEEKNKISHRAAAFAHLPAMLERYFKE
ncbi:MAG: RdgB/HAM1 family non-canonical purine NTP pyrophosphatase [Myxococcota bacterium]